MIQKVENKFIIWDFVLLSRNRAKHPGLSERIDIRMKVSDIAENLSLEILCGDTGREINGCYIGDLLSWVMSHAKYAEVWITIMSNVNVVAVASLVDVACVVIAEGVEPEDDVITLAKQKDVCILKSDKTVFELAALFAKTFE